MFLNSAKQQLIRAFPAVLSRRQQCLRSRETMSISCVYAEPQSLKQPIEFLKSSVVPAHLPHLHPSQHTFNLDPPLAYDVLQGSLVRHCEMGSVSPPTIVLVHGILGSKKNLHSFAKRLLKGYPSWQAVLVDLPCHGESQCARSPFGQGPLNVESAAHDILRLLNYLKLFPRVLIGHSFGGKVVMSMAHQFGQTLPRPVQAWVLDTLPGDVADRRATRQDHPFDLIKTLQAIPLPVLSRSSLIQQLRSSGFSASIANWMTTNLRKDPSKDKGFTWAFDLNGIEELYKSYESSSLWPLLYTPPEGLKIDFVRAEKSHFRWTDRVQQEIELLGHRVHLLRDAGHWVHADNPDGLYHIVRQEIGQEEFGGQKPCFI